MNKVKEKLMDEKVIKIIYYILIAILAFFIILNTKLDNMDEIWNFSFAKNIINGLVPYKDFNVIVTPLSMYLNGLLLMINSHLLTFRIIYFIYYIVIIFLFDKIFDILKIKKILKYIFIPTFIFILVKRCYLDYNFLQFILLILLLYLNLKNNDYSNHKLNIVIPLLSGLTIINKQSTGLVICFIYLLLLLLNKFYFKKKIDGQFILKQIFLMIVPTLLFILYLFLFDNYREFYDLAIIGLTTFSNNLLDKQLLLSILLLYLTIVVILFLNKKNNELWTIFLYAVASLAVIIPIVDMVHTTLAMVIPFLFVFLVINEKIKDLPSTILYLIIPIFVMLIINNISIYNKKLKINEGIYKGIPVTESLNSLITTVDDYMLNNEHNVYILDYSAALFDMNIDRYNKYFDLFMNGNFGVKGEKKIIDIIDNSNQIFLINNQKSNWQTPTEIIDYVKEKYNYCGRVSYFDAYCKQ